MLEGRVHDGVHTLEQRPDAARLPQPPSTQATGPGKPVRSVDGPRPGPHLDPVRQQLGHDEAPDIAAGPGDRDAHGAQPGGGETSSGSPRPSRMRHQRSITGPSRSRFGCGSAQGFSYW